MDMPTTCPRFFAAAGIKEDKAPRSAELSLDNLSLQNTVCSHESTGGLPLIVGAQGLRRVSRAGRPPLSPSLPAAGRRKRASLDDVSDGFTTSETDVGACNLDLGLQRTPGRDSPPRAKAARFGKMSGSFPSVSNLSAFIGNETDAESGPPMAHTVRTTDSLPTPAARGSIPRLQALLFLHLLSPFPSCLPQGLRRAQSGGALKESGMAPWQRYSDWRRENPSASRAESRAFIERALGGRSSSSCMA